MLSSDVIVAVTDFGAGPNNAQENPAAPTHRKVPLRQMVRHSGSTPEQGQQLFRLAQFLKPKTILELGSSTGLGSMYLASGAMDAAMITLEGCPNTANIASNNLQWLGCKKAKVGIGPFDQTLLPALKELSRVDLVFFDGNHRLEPTLEYFEKCMPFAHNESVFIFDDVYWSKGMTSAWEHIRRDPRITLSVDFADFSLAFFNQDFKIKQHFTIVPYGWKPWKFY